MMFCLALPPSLLKLSDSIVFELHGDTLQMFDLCLSEYINFFSDYSETSYLHQAEDCCKAEKNK